MRPLRFLLVDDAADDRALVKQVLFKADPALEIAEATDARELARLLDSAPYDLVITDYNILGFSGLDVLAAIKERQPDTPVILLTGTGSEEVAVAALKQGAADYVVKSIQHIKKLPSTVTAVLQRAALERERASLVENLRVSEARYRSLVETAPDAILSIDAGGRVAFFSRTAEKMFGCEAAEVVGHPPEILAAPDSAEMLAEALEQNRHSRRRGPAPVITTVMRKKNGATFPAEVSFAPFSDGQGVGFTVVIRDVTEKKKWEEEKERLARMAAVGEMTAAVAHEVRNPLAAIAASAAVTKQELDAAGLSSNGPDWILRAVRKIEFLLERFFAFARPLTLQRERFSLAEVAKEVVTAQMANISAAVNLSWEIETDDTEIMADRALVAAAIQNFVSNALEAMPAGGELKIGIAAMGDDRLRLSVSDTGHGMPADVLGRVAEPFFTTKKGGVGLGLAFAYKIVRAHGGDWDIRSAEGVGTCVTVTLPRRT